MFAAFASALATYEAAVVLAAVSMNYISTTHELFDASTIAIGTDQPPLPVIEVIGTSSKFTGSYEAKYYYEYVAKPPLISASTVKSAEDGAVVFLKTLAWT